MINPQPCRGRSCGPSLDSRLAVWELNDLPRECSVHAIIWCDFSAIRPFPKTENEIKSKRARSNVALAIAVIAVRRYLSFDGGCFCFAVLSLCACAHPTCAYVCVRIVGCVGVCVGSGWEGEGMGAVARCVRHSDSSSPSLPCARKASRRLTYVSCGSPLFFSNSGRSFFGFLCCCFDIHSEKERKNRAGWLDVRMHPVLSVCVCVCMRVLFILFMLLRSTAEHDRRRRFAW